MLTKKKVTKLKRVYSTRARERARNLIAKKKRGQMKNEEIGQMTAKAARRFRDSNSGGKQEKFSKTGHWRKLLATRTLRTMLKVCFKSP